MRFCWTRNLPDIRFAEISLISSANGCSLSCPFIRVQVRFAGLESALGRRSDHILRENKEEDFDTAGSEIYIDATRHFAIACTRQIEDVEICLG
jgi:hypothetical protein